MQTYVCGICGFVYDEAAGYPEGGIAPGTRWEDLPDDWVCPLCGASKDVFELQNKTEPASSSKKADSTETLSDENLSAKELSALFSNLSKGCEKQYRQEEATLFRRLEDYYGQKTAPEKESQLSALTKLAKDDLSSGFEDGQQAASSSHDRGAMRALTWSEKVTKNTAFLLNRYEAHTGPALEQTNIYVCEICGFIYVGEKAPEICPVCKVPKQKLKLIPKGVA